MFRSVRAFVASHGSAKLGRTLTGALLAVLILAGTVACNGGGNPNRQGSATTVSGVSEVTVHDNYFEPESISVPAGTTVTWRWEGGSAHNVVGDGFESPTQTEGEFSYTFTEPGTYPYECTLHGGMTGEVIVTAAAS